jgi:transposase-like protein
MYKKTYSRIKAILKSLQKGASIHDACRGAGIDVVSFWRWRKADPKLDEIVKTMYDSRVQIVEDALYKGALEGNVTSQIFFLKNRATNRWRDSHEIKGEGFGDTKIILINGKNADKPSRIPEAIHI